MKNPAETLLPTLLLVAAVISVPVLVLRPEGLPRMKSLKAELGDVERENADSRRQIAQLRAEVSRLRDEPAAVERIARDQLGFVRKSEVVVHFTQR